MRLDEILEAVEESITGEAREEELDGIRKIILQELGVKEEDEDTEDIVRQVSKAVTRQIELMIWPAKDLEVMRRQLEREVDREAEVREIVRETLHLMSAHNG